MLLDIFAEILTLERVLPRLDCEGQMFNLVSRHQKALQILQVLGVEQGDDGLIVEVAVLELEIAEVLHARAVR